MWLFLTFLRPTDWFSLITTKASTPHPPDTGIVIECSDRHLNQIDPASGSYRDPGRGNSPVRVDSRNRGQGACGGVMSGLTYSFDYNVGTQRKTGAVVLLCSDSSIGIINSRPPHTVSQFRENDIRTFTIDYFRNFMSVKILHEFIHAADVNWCKTKPPPYLYLKYFYMHNLTGFSFFFSLEATSGNSWGPASIRTVSRAYLLFPNSSELKPTARGRM